MLINLNTRAVHFCRYLINAISEGFQKRFGNILNLNNEVAILKVIFASVTHVYFKLRSVTINGRWNLEEREEFVI